VGELMAARPLLGALRDGFPGHTVVVSTVTETGLARARELREADGAFLFPLDAPGPIARLVARWHPQAFLFTETEIWPTCLATLAVAGVPAFMVSGRVSVHTAARARWLRPLFRRALAPVVCCMQSAEDAARVTALGADPARVHVTGNLKFDGSVPAPPPELGRVAAALALDRHRLLIGGSTHEGEEHALLRAYRLLAPAAPDVLLALAPRHPGRFAAVAAAAADDGWSVVRYSALAEGSVAAVRPPAVILLDAIGPLAACYGLAAVAFVGGSLVPVGGHNVLEPARVGCPVVVGPHTEHGGNVVAQLVAAGAARRVHTPDELAAVTRELLADPAACSAMGERARAMVARGAGAVARHLAVITAHLGHGAPRVPAAGRS
jgi:3-deoxy-D-manno-octulosonic-acid transferase